MANLKPRKVEWRSWGETIDLEGTHLCEPGQIGILEGQRAKDFERHGNCHILEIVDDPRREDEDEESSEDSEPEEEG